MFSSWRSRVSIHCCWFYFFFPRFFGQSTLSGGHTTWADTVGDTLVCKYS
jgi:hypothetical protein